MSLHLLLITSVDIPMVIHHPLESHYQTMDLPAIDVCLRTVHVCVYGCKLMAGQRALNSLFTDLLIIQNWKSLSQTSKI